MRRRVRAIRAVFAISLATLVSGCYELRPTMEIGPRTDVQFTVALSDQGRVAVASQLGPEVRDVTGHVLARSGDDLLFAVQEVTYLRGDLLKMSSDSVHLNRQYLTSVIEKKFSLGKTMIVAAGVAVAVGVLLGSTSLFGHGGSASDGPVIPPSTSFRHP